MADGFDNIVGGLFGASPEGLKIAREQQNLNFAKEVANAEAQRAGAGSVLGANVMGARGVQQLGNLFGVEDPLMQRVSQQQQLLGGVDFTDLKSLKTAAQEAAKAGRPDIAQELAKRALDIQVRVEDKQAARDTQLQIARERIQGQLDAAIQRGADQKEIARILADGRQQMAMLAASLKGEGADKPLAAGTVKEIATAARTNNVLTRTNTTLDNYITDVDTNKIEFNLGKNIAGWVQRGTGKQDANTLKQISLGKFLENERNNILLAAKGTQTEGDANRAMSQIFNKTDWTSNAAVSQALADLKDYKNAQIDSNNVFIGSLRGGGLPTAPAAAPTTPPPAPKAAPQGKDYTADYKKYKDKYQDKALSYEAYVANRTGKQ
jgi:hypothetical protein